MSREPARRRRRAPRQRPTEDNALAGLGIDHRQQRMLTIAGVVAGVAAGAVALTVAVASLGGGVSAGSRSGPGIGQAAPATYRGWTSPALFAPIATRQADPAPLTGKEVFGAKTLKAERVTLKLAARGVDGDCAAAVWGEELAGRLADAGCSQAVRGLFVSSDRRYAAQYTLLNLRDTEAANALVEELSTLYRGGWTRVLDSPKAAFPAAGHTEAGGHAMGHFAGLVWIARLDGEPPAPRDDFVALSLAVRGAEKAVYRRVVAVTGPRPTEAR